jgi:Zn-finger nucleic acid-binding protein
MEGCEACGGVWLGPEAAVHVLRGLGDERELEIVRLTASHEMRVVAARAADTGARGCPTCTQVMGRLTVGATIVDSCPAHGAWFDRREIGEVVVACGALQKRHSAEVAERRAPVEQAYRAIEREGREPEYHAAPSDMHGAGSSLLGTILEAMAALILQGK